MCCFYFSGFYLLWSLWIVFPAHRAVPAHNTSVKRPYFKPDLVRHTCKASTWEAETEGSRVWGQPRLRSDKTLSQKPNKQKIPPLSPTPSTHGWLIQCGPVVRLGPSEPLPWDLEILIQGRGTTSYWHTLMGKFQSNDPHRITAAPWGTSCHPTASPYGNVLCKWLIPNAMYFYGDFFGGTGVWWTQDLTLARQVLYHLSH
jgi:hypothetical protein